ncbi:MAG: hypothetical protein RLZ04_196 [Actinomycetota bacterium]
MNTQLTHAAASTMPPLKPTAEDLVLLAGAQEAELAARDLYDAGIAAASWTEEQATLMVALRESHEAYAQSLSAMLGVKGSGVASADITAANEVGMSSSDAAAVLAAAQALEATLVAAHLGFLAQLEAIDAAALVSSILMAEGRHGTALADLAGATDLATLLGAQA